MREIKLSKGEIALTISPNVGGSISRLVARGNDILRPSEAHNRKAMNSACYPMVPVVNRIPRGKFTFLDQAVRLSGNFEGSPDFIHGHGWSEKWDVISVDTDRAVLEFTYDEKEWPWPYLARQVFELAEDALIMHLSVTNLSDKIMPAMLGFHPHFLKSADTMLSASYEGYWENNDHCHVTKRVKGSLHKDYTHGADLVDTITIDHTHFGWQGPAVLQELGRPTIEITASENISNLHIYCPAGGNFVALEPTIGRSDPFGVLPQEYINLAPTETLSIWMKIKFGH